ncbi:beta-galactosidase [Seramator thermalis]|uniref:beta-galactosidase n=1 Tax=Seramator thermalis TaxID=2496270 RepID=UPI00101D8C8E|nr:beta-galactosidase [Seramator thermalis]
MIVHYRKAYLLFLLIFIFTSCLTDAGEDYKTIITTAKDIATLTANVDLSRYPKVKDTTDFPIIAWLGVPPKYTNIERFREAKDAGININYSFYPNVDSVQKALDIAKQVGMKILIRCPELESNTLSTVKKFKDHPANAGYFIKDESTLYDLPYLKKIIQTIASVDDQHLCYVNLYPNSILASDLGARNYSEYIRRSVEELSLKVISFDFYPILNGNNIRYGWYKNLEIIRDESRDMGKPFWAFALTTSHGDYPIPTLEHLRLQVYSNLAYGAKGIQYYTYWTYNSLNFQYYSGPIEKDGSRTLVYDHLKKMNSEINALKYIFLSGEVKNVSHYGSNIPDGGKRLAALPDYVKSLDIKCNTALISEIENDSNRFLMIQNNDLHSPIEVTIKVDSLTKIVLKNGSIIPFSLINQSFKIESGDMVLFMR